MFHVPTSTPLDEVSFDELRAYPTPGLGLCHLRLCFPSRGIAGMAHADGGASPPSHEAIAFVELIARLPQQQKHEPQYFSKG